MDNNNNNNIKLLIADADPSVRAIVRRCAEDEKWLLDEAKDGIEAVKLLRRKKYHLIILEVELPVIDGFMICENLKHNPDILVIFISKKSSEIDRLAAFEAGGNDYIIKPFYPRELVARIKNLLKLAGIVSMANQFLYSGKLKIDLYSQDVYADNRRIKLTPREYNLLLFFCRNPNKAFSRSMLLDLVWGRQFEGTDRTVDTHVKSLREKIKPYHNYITTVWGYGYKYEVKSVL
ncbi:MAG: response regulator transcription factor [Bacillota bacterium]|nr:response regulator transcription factor [Bacillota bacterium]HHU30069.1 response regulator transcription factor [Bacillota bacterium]